MTGWSTLSLYLSRLIHLACAPLYQSVLTPNPLTRESGGGRRVPRSEPTGINNFVLSWMKGFKDTPTKETNLAPGEIIFRKMRAAIKIGRDPPPLKQFPFFRNLYSAPCYAQLFIHGIYKLATIVSRQKYSLFFFK